MIMKLFENYNILNKANTNVSNCYSTFKSFQLQYGTQNLSIAIMQGGIVNSNNTFKSYKLKCGLHVRGDEEIRS